MRYYSTQVTETDKDRTYVVDVGQMKADDLDLKLLDDVLSLRGFHEEKTFVYAHANKRTHMHQS